MLFWQSLKRSVHDPEFYREVSKQSFSQGFSFFIRYILLLSAMVSLVILTYLGIFLFGGKFDEMMRDAKSFYPDDLVVTIVNGKISINQEQPYAIPLPVSGNIKDKEGDLNYLAVIDTEYPITLEALKEYKTVTLVGESSIGFRDDSGTLKIYEIPKEVNMVIDRSWVDGTVDKGIGAIKKVGFGVAFVGVPLAIFIGFTIGVMMYLIFAALIVWIIARVNNLSYSYKQSYVASMYLITVPQALSVVFFWLAIIIPYFRTIIFIVLAILNLKKDDHQSAVMGQQQDGTQNVVSNTSPFSEVRTDLPNTLPEKNTDRPDGSKELEKEKE